MRAAGFLALATLSACAAQPDAHIPPFARAPYEPISREAVVQIALREWRLFGQVIDDDSAAPAEKPERASGLWQRVGEYWWLGLNATEPEVAWTGKHDAKGALFPASADGQFAWSAAFISYVLRIAGARQGFPYAASHWEYIDRARLAVDKPGASIVIAERPEAYAPRPGDLICLGRGNAAALRYEHLPAGPFPAHCDIVVAVTAGQIDAIGGNVRDAVVLKHVPVTEAGMLATPDGRVLDQQHPWMVVLRLAVGAPA